MQVEFIDKMGTDLTIVNAARVSFNKRKEVLDMSDEKLIKYLATHEHWTPFAHCFLSLRVKAPIFVARQLAKHQVGLVWNEVSRRYVENEPEFYVPDVWRKRSKSNKQGSIDESAGSVDITSVLDDIKQMYNDLLAIGVAPEQARMILPACTYTEWYWSGSLVAFARVCKLRLSDDTQKETRQIAAMIDKIARQNFPLGWGALNGN